MKTRTGPESVTALGLCSLFAALRSRTAAATGTPRLRTSAGSPPGRPRGRDALLSALQGPGQGVPPTLVSHNPSCAFSCPPHPQENTRTEQAVVWARDPLPSSLSCTSEPRARSLWRLLPFLPRGGSSRASRESGLASHCPANVLPRRSVSVPGEAEVAAGQTQVRGLHTREGQIREALGDAGRVFVFPTALPRKGPVVCWGGPRKNCADAGRCESAQRQRPLPGRAPLGPRSGPGGACEAGGPLGPRIRCWRPRAGCR